MPQFFPQVFITGVVLFLLLGAGYGIATIQARAIPWDCSDWQAFDHDDRTTAILESLAENRGKTLYCGVDQSDTFTKAETWEAGKDRNERDDTVYFGERGSFRGFIAAQEGYLTDGESGITGISIDRIFEFPREQKKRRRREPRLLLRYDREYPKSSLIYPGLTSTGFEGGGYLAWNPAPPPYFVRSPRIVAPSTLFSGNAFVRALSSVSGAHPSAQATAQTNARNAFTGAAIPTDAQAAEWALNGSGTTVDAELGSLEVRGGATAECQALGWNRAVNVRWWYQDTDGDSTVDQYLTADLDGSGGYEYKAYRVILYTATCKK